MNKKMKKKCPALDDPENIIDADDFEHLCDCLIEAWALAQPAHIHFERRWAEPSPVDIILDEKIQEKKAFHQSRGVSDTRKKRHLFKNAHFIECKFYKKNLTLDVVAKSLLIAVRYSPKTFTIATNTPLDEQAIEYRNYIVDETPQAPEEIAIWFPLQKELKGKKPKLAKYEPIGSFGESYSTDSIQLQVRDQFHCEDVPLGQTSVFSLHDKSELLFTSRLLPPPPPRTKHALETYILSVRNGYEECFDIPLSVEKGRPAKDKTFLKAQIPAINLKPNVIYTKWALNLVGSGKFIQTIPLPGLPYIVRAIASPVLPEMRKGEIDQLFKCWMGSDRHILLVSGVGGIGKTHLCESICAKAVYQGFRVAEVSLSSEYDPAFITDFAWSAFGSRIKCLIEGQNEEIKDLFIQTQVAGSRGALSEIEVDALVKVIRDGCLETAQTEVVLGNLARLLVLRKQPILLYVRDLHKATDTVRNSFRHIIKGLESSKWGQVRVILERRVQEDDASNACNQNRAEPDLWQWLKHFCRKECLSYENMQPLPASLIENGLQNILSCENTRRVASLLAYKCKGNLQELSFLLRRLFDDQTLVSESCYQQGELHTRYTVPSLNTLRKRLNLIMSDDISSIHRRIHETHQALVLSGKPQGCYWLGLISLLDMKIDAPLLASLLGVEAIMEVESLLSYFVGEAFLIRSGDGILFAHESIEDAAKTWFAGLTLHKLWLRENAVTPILPARFEDGFARGKLWSYLNDPDAATKAFDAALGYTAHDFSRQFRCRQEIHRLLLGQNEYSSYGRFFDNFLQLLFCGQYILSSEALIELLEEAISYLDNIDVTKLPPLNEKLLRFSFHHAISGHYLATMSMDQYFHHAQKALNAATGLHDIGKMLNRLLMACAQSGDIYTCLNAGATGLALADLVSPEVDPDLLSVNCDEFSFAVASSSSELALRLAERAQSNSQATFRQQAHDQYVLACALVQNNRLNEAQAILSRARATASASSMNSLLLGITNCQGVLSAMSGAWEEARSNFESCLDEASWQGYRLEALKAKQNLLISYVMTSNYHEAATIYPDLLGQCLKQNATHYFESGSQLFQSMMDRVECFISLRNEATGGSICLQQLLSSSRAMFAQSWPENLTNEESGNPVHVISKNLISLEQAMPEYFHFPEKSGLLILAMKKLEAIPLSNALACGVLKSLDLYLIC